MNFERLNFIVSKKLNPKHFKLAAEFVVFRVLHERWGLSPSKFIFLMFTYKSATQKLEKTWLALLVKNWITKTKRSLRGWDREKIKPLTSNLTAFFVSFYCARVCTIRGMRLFLEFLLLSLTCFFKFFST